MAKRLSRRKRLKRDPMNQRPGKLLRWAIKNGYAAAVAGSREPPDKWGHRSRPAILWRAIYYHFEHLRHAQRMAEKRRRDELAWQAGLSPHYDRPIFRNPPLVVRIDGP